MGFVDDLLVVGNDNGRKFGGGGSGQWLKMMGFRNMRALMKKKKINEMKKKIKKIDFFRFIGTRHS